MLKKEFLALFLAGFFLLSSCGNSKDNNSEQQEKNPTATNVKIGEKYTDKENYEITFESIEWKYPEQSSNNIKYIAVKIDLKNSFTEKMKLSDIITCYGLYEDKYKYEISGYYNGHSDWDDTPKDTSMSMSREELEQIYNTQLSDEDIESIKKWNMQMERESWQCQHNLVVKKTPKEDDYIYEGYDTIYPSVLSLIPLESTNFYVITKIPSTVEETDNYKLIFSLNDDQYAIKCPTQ